MIFRFVNVLILPCNLHVLGDFKCLYDDTNSNKLYPKMQYAIHPVDIKQFLSLSVSNSQVYSLLVSQNVTNWVTADVLSKIADANCQSVFIHLGSSDLLSCPTPRTNAILQFIHHHKLPLFTHTPVESNKNWIHDLIQHINDTANIGLNSLPKWNLTQQRNYTLNTDIDQFLFCPIISQYEQTEKPVIGQKTFAKNALFMKDFKMKLSLNVMSQEKPFQLRPLHNHVNNTELVKYIFGEEGNNVKLWYFENKELLGRDTSQQNVQWKRVHSFLKTVFEKKDDRDGIDRYMRHQETQCIQIECKHNGADRPKTIGCVLFTNFRRHPFGAFIAYVALNKKFKTELLGNEFKSGKPMDQVFRQGIARKLMQMVQFVSWVKVKNISMHLCATSTSLQFYESMKFQKYGSEFLNLPLEM